jgi:hypothetical protein
MRPHLFNDFRRIVLTRAWQSAEPVIIRDVPSPLSQERCRKMSQQIIASSLLILAALAAAAAAHGAATKAARAEKPKR